MQKTPAIFQLLQNFIHLPAPMMSPGAVSFVWTVPDT